MNALLHQCSTKRCSLHAILIQTIENIAFSPDFMGRCIANLASRQAQMKHKKPESS
jgi:hypothetical protein